MPAAPFVFPGHRLFRLCMSGRECALVSFCCGTNVARYRTWARCEQTSAWGTSANRALTGCAANRRHLGLPRSDRQTPLSPG
jgi:hypothetical protein